MEPLKLVHQTFVLGGFCSKKLVTKKFFLESLHFDFLNNILKIENEIGCALKVIKGHKVKNSIFCLLVLKRNNCSDYMKQKMITIPDATFP